MYPPHSGQIHIVTEERKQTADIPFLAFDHSPCCSELAIGATRGACPIEGPTRIGRSVLL